MKYVLTIVEQLDRAATELATDHPINNRLALILIDNATELMLHRQCLGHLRRDRWDTQSLRLMETIAKSKPFIETVGFPDDFGKKVMTPKQRNMAKGRSFDGKLKVLERMEDITPHERRFIAIAHDYRNELYHLGLKHDNIIRSIAGHYFLLCCELFVRLKEVGLWVVVFSSEDKYTDIAKHYLPLRDGQLDFMAVDHGVLADKLRYNLPDDIRELPTILADSGHEAIEEVSDSFDFLVYNNSRGLDAPAMLELAQWDQDLACALEQKDVDDLLTGTQYRETYTEVRDSLTENWKPQHSFIPSEKWLSRASAIEIEPDPLVAMDLYQLLRNDMRYLEEAIQSEAEELDRWIQDEIDRIRGK